MNLKSGMPAIAVASGCALSGPGQRDDAESSGAYVIFGRP